MTTEALTGGLSPSETERLLAIGSGDAALLLMYARQKGLAWPDAMPGWAGERLQEARTLLRDAGFFTAPVPDTGSGRPSYPAAEIKSGGLSDPAFAHVARETERLLGKPLSSQDLQFLYGMYDWRGLPPGVLLLLIHFCLSEAERRYGPGGRAPSLRQIDREAAIWAGEGLFTEPLAEAYIQQKEQSQEKASRVFRHIGVFPRRPSPTEKKYVAEWLSLGFDIEAIALAYDKTVTATGKMAWAYCHKILTSWHGQGLHSAGEIEARAGKPPSGRPDGGQAPPAPRRGGIDHTREVLNRIKR